MQDLKEQVEKEPSERWSHKGGPCAKNFGPMQSLGRQGRLSGWAQEGKKHGYLSCLSCHLLTSYEWLLVLHPTGSPKHLGMLAPVKPVSWAQSRTEKGG